MKVTYNLKALAFVGAALVIMAAPTEGGLMMPAKKSKDEPVFHLRGLAKRASLAETQPRKNLGETVSHLRHLMGCTSPVEINFNELSHNDYVSNFYETLYGVRFSAFGGFGDKPRVFDTSNPGVLEDGDPDLGSPNKHCTPPGPGIGQGGKPGTAGANCKAQGNALIIEEDGGGVPDDNQISGTIIINFEPTAQYVNSIGFLDVDSVSYVTVFGASGQKKTIGLQPVLGKQRISGNGHQQ